MVVGIPRLSLVVNSKVINGSKLGPCSPVVTSCGVSHLWRNQLEGINICGGTTLRNFRTMSISPEAQAKLDKVADAKVDNSGKFKYILIKVYATDGEGKHVDSNSKLVVRGRADCPYHSDIYDKFQEETSKLEGLDDEVLGGGRILREGNKISVFGYSQGYGKADHTLTVEILKRAFPTHEITWSDEGY